VVDRASKAANSSGRLQLAGQNLGRPARHVRAAKKAAELIGEGTSGPGPTAHEGGPRYETAAPEVPPQRFDQLVGQEAIAATLA